MTEPAVIIRVLYHGRRGLVVDCIPFSWRGCEPCYAVWFADGVVLWCTEDELTFEEEAA
jgi:hypothetical protein